MIAHVGVVPLEELAPALAGVGSRLILHLRRGRLGLMHPGRAWKTWSGLSAHQFQSPGDTAAAMLRCSRFA